MPDNYAVLYGKYQRALVSIRELEQERARYEEEARRIKESHTVLDKSMQELCVTIIKKKHVPHPKNGDSKNDDEKMWRNMPPLDLIRKAQEEIDNYFPTVEKEVNELFEAMERKTQIIHKLEDDIKKLKSSIDDANRVKEEAIKKISEQTDNADDRKNIVKLLRAGTATEPVDINMDSGETIEFSSEPKDALEDEVGEAIEVIIQEGDIQKQLPKNTRVKLNTEAKEAIKKKAIEKLQEKAESAGTIAEKLTDVQKDLIVVFGDTGISEATALLEETKKRYPNIPTNARVSTALYDLMKAEDDERVIRATMCSVPGLPHFKVYKLTSVGQDVYTYLTGKDAVEAEMDKIRKNHTTLEHGYGIRQTANILQKSAYIGENDEIIYLTRAKEHSVKIGENISYIPDIVIKQTRNGKEKLFYIEYETGKCPDVAFFEKCNKIASFSKFINIIVPSNEAKAETVSKIEKWRDKVMDGTYEIKYPVRFKLSTYFELKEGCKSTSIPWLWEKTVSPPKK